MSRRFSSWFFLPLILIALGAGCTSSSNVVTSTKPTTSSSTSPSTPMTDSNAFWTKPTILPADQITHKQVRIHTEKGDIVIAMLADTAPLTVSNFVYLAEHNFYNGLTFHRREDSLHIIQGGDPKGNGTGGPGYRFADELNDSYTYSKGIVAMANAGPNTNGSQFFIMLDAFPFEKNYTVFGRVTEGLDVAQQMQVGDKMLTVTVEDQP